MGTGILQYYYLLQYIVQRWYYVRYRYCTDVLYPYCTDYRLQY